MNPMAFADRSRDTAHFIGIDVGTGSARACIIDDTGDIKALAAENIKLWNPQKGHYEQSTTDIWNCICACVKKIVQDSAVDTSTIKGIGFDATCSLAVFSHDTDEPISVTSPKFDNADGCDRNIILWLDQRPIEETEAINSTNHDLLKYVGGRVGTEMEIPKVLWLKNNMPPELFDRCRFYDLTDALTHLATGTETRSLCSVVSKEGYVPVGIDGSVKGWPEGFLTAIGLGELAEDNFKRIGGVDANGNYFSAGELVGHLSPTAAEQLGLPAGIAIGSGVIDAYAGWVGTVGAKVDSEATSNHLDDAMGALEQASSRLAAVAGTSTCHIAMSKEPISVPGVWGPYRDVLLPQLWLSEGGQSATGELLRHIIDIHPAWREAHAKAIESGAKNIYEYLNKHLEQLAQRQGAPTISYLGRHFFLYGDFWGNRSPIADSNMRGSVIGISSDKGIDNLALWYYGAMEFIALQTRQIVEQMNKAGHGVSSIFMSGSQCQNPVLMDLLATTCAMPVIIPKYVDAAVVHGAAMLGAKAGSADAQGNTESLWTIMDRMSKPGRLITPSGSEREKELLDAKYDVFLEQCETQQRYRSMVDAAVKSWKS